MMAKTTFIPFDPKPWRGHLALRLSETAGIPRVHTPVDISFEVPVGTKQGMALAL
jgi:hypothetical protein